MQLPSVKKGKKNFTLKAMLRILEKSIIWIDVDQYSGELSSIMAVKFQHK